MSGVLDTLLEMWFVHKATYSSYGGTTYDEDNRPVTDYGDPVEIPSCRLYDLTELEMNTLAQAGLVNVTKRVIVPPNLDLPYQSKIGNFLTNGKDIEGIEDTLVDPNFYTMERSMMRRSTVDEYKQFYLRRLQ